MTGRALTAGGDFLSNPVFLSAISSLLLAQFIKAIVNLLRERGRSLRETLLTFFWKTGGMPSSHSSLAVSIATAIGIMEGPGSNLFILSLFFALVVIRDAMGVRRSSGLQARAINALGKRFAARFGETHTPVKEVLGHSPSQVLVGSVLGFFMALAFCTL
jgi:acid phosphatase family membrane protein YuiD